MLISDYEYEFKTLLKEALDSDDKYKNCMEQFRNGTVGMEGSLY